MSGMRRECGMPAICGRQPRENSTRNADGRGKTSGSSSSSSPSSSLVLLVVVVVVAVLVNVVVFVVAPLVVVVGVAVAVAIQPRWCCWCGLLLRTAGNALPAPFCSGQTRNLWTTVPRADQRRPASLLRGQRSSSK